MQMLDTATMKPSSWLILIVTTLSCPILVYMDHKVWQDDCEDAQYVPTHQATLPFLKSEYHRRFGPPPESQPNTVGVSEISTDEELHQANFSCGTRAPDAPAEPLTAGGLSESSFPWVVAVQGGKYFCAGVLLTMYHVLSPARCVDESSKVILGNKSRKNMTSTTHIRHAAATYLNSELNVFDQGFDIGLIKLDKPVTYNTTIRPICLPTARSEFHFYNCYLTNWGRYDPLMKELSDDLLVVSAEVMEAYECQFRYKLVQKTLRDSEACLGFKEKRGVSHKCSVDTGGPLLCEVNGTYFVAALASQVESGCTNELLPDLFTKVASHESWILQKVFIK